MYNYKSIVEDIENVSERKVVKQKKMPVAAIGLLVGAGICVLGGMAIEDPNSSLSTFLFTTAVFLFLVSVVKFWIGKECYLFKPTGSCLQKTTVYFDNKESLALQNSLADKRFEELKQLKRQFDTGVKLEIMFAADRKFVALQVSEYVPYTYQAVSPVICYYGNEAENFMSFLKE